MRLAYTLNPRKIALTLIALSLYFAAQSLIVEFLIENVLDADTHSTLILVIDLFSVNAEQTIPTWYATMLLFVAGTLLAVIASAKLIQQDSYRRHWVGLAVVFLYLSMDEGAAIHEILSDALELWIEPTGYLFFSWLIVVAPLVILFALLYLRFLFHLPPRIRNLFILAGLLYVGGAIVVEAISANRWYLDGGQTFEYLAIATIEESCEMLGVVALIYTLLTYIAAMRYSATFFPSTSVEKIEPVVVESPQPLEVQHGEPRFPLTGHVLIVVGLIILVANTALVSWSLAQVPASTIIQRDAATINQAILDHLASYDVQVTHLEGHFSLENVASRQAAASLLSEFNNVMIITWSAAESSIAVSADEIPFDRNSLTEVLYAHGETQFVIYETGAVRAIVGDVQPLRADQ